MDINATLIGEAIAFAIMIWFCVSFIWPPLQVAIKERQKKIAEGLAAADKAKADLTAADARVAEEIKAARATAADIVEKANQQAGQILDKAKGDALVEAARVKAGAQAEIDGMVSKARETLRDQVSALVVQGAGKIIGRELDVGTHKALLDQLASEI